MVHNVFALDLLAGEIPTDDTAMADRDAGYLDEHTTDPELHHTMKEQHKEPPVDVS